MTLIVSVISKNFIVQTVDRKITKGQANLDYDRDKLILCNCRGARFSVAFTGDASAYNAPASSGSRNIVFPEETQTAPWVAATLSNLSRDCDSLESVLEGFEQAVNKTYKPPNAGIAIFIFTGYKYLQVGTEQIVVPFWTTINNCQLTHQTYRSKVVWTSVDPNLFPQEQSPVLHVQIDGMLPAVSESSANDFLERLEKV